MEKEPQKKDELNGNVIEFRKGPSSIIGKSGVSGSSVIRFEHAKQGQIYKQENLKKADELFEQGATLEETGNFVRAKKKYLEALNFNPNHTGALLNLGSICVKSSSLTDLTKAENYYLRAVEIDPSYSLAHYNLGCVYEKQHKQASASLCYAKALEINPKYADVAFNLALCLKDEESYQLSLDYFNLFLKLDQSDNHFTKEAKRQVKILEALLK
jgi:tetratricopeptide (TPR) repeat protein